ncbi:MAG: hypothetical protein PHO37_02315 [Kiritimatiellae bacterium]|nr:hypothetical protein [Kiritimatiellia bacterium]
MKNLFITMVLLLVAITLQAEPLAWIRLGCVDGQRYMDHPYHWLGDSALYLEVDFSPAEGAVLELLWGAKGDQRGAVVNVNKKEQVIIAGGYQGFQWQRVKLPPGALKTPFQISILPGQPNAAFLAGLRICKADANEGTALPAAGAFGIKVIEPPAHDLFGWMEELQRSDLTINQRAVIHGQQANEALRRCRKYVDGWLAHADPKTGLIPRNLGESNFFWNGRDSAADNYAFMVLTCALTDRKMFDGRMREMLETETKVTSRIGALPDDYDFNKQAFRHEKPDVNRLIFDGSEYVKDGLMPITEWLGATPWSERMISIVDSVLEHAAFDTPGGRIPSNNVEVNGEMMQVLSRLYFTIGKAEYLDMACRIADYYLLGEHHPTRNIRKLGLRDHNCELISGLTEVYAACHFVRKEKAAAYRQPIHEMLDTILKVGVNEHGLMYQVVDPQSGEVLDKNIHDNWGYNYNGFYTVYQLDGVERYRTSVRKALSSLKPHYWKFAWEGWSSDGIADSVEGALNLFNREPDVAGVPEWIDSNMARMLLIQRPDGVIEGWHGDGNYARTAIMWALWKQQGVTLQPWREDVRLGSVRDEGALHLVVTVEQPWKGRLIFDQPRHRTNMKMPADYPRINQFPEWFAVSGNATYLIHQGDDSAKETVTGAALVEGLELDLRAGEQRHLVVQNKEFR